MMGWVLIAAVGMAALRYASPLWARVIFLATCAVHASSALGMICTRQTQRAVFLGRALFGWGYLALFLCLSYDDSGLIALPTQRALELMRDALIPQHTPQGSISAGYRTAELRYDFVQPMPERVENLGGAPVREQFSVQPVQAFAGMGGFGCVRPDPSEECFYRIGHCLWSLVAAMFGGILARVYSRHTNAESPDTETAPARNAASRPASRWPAVAFGVATVSVLLCGAVAVARRSEIGADAVVLATFSLLGAAILGAFPAGGQHRRNWLGAALFGGGYMVLAFVTPVFRDGDGNTILPCVLSCSDSHDLRTRVPFLSPFLPGSSDNNPTNDAIFKALNQRLDLPSLKQETAIEDVFTMIRAATKGPQLPSGIPFYVDPVGLQEAEKTLTSPVTLMLEPGEISIRTGLHLLLEQLGLEYFVTDGMVVVTHHGSSVTQSLIFSGYQRMGHCAMALLAMVLGVCASRLVGARVEGV
jgi:hypothetical protein